MRLLTARKKTNFGPWRSSMKVKDGREREFCWEISEFFRSWNENLVSKFSPSTANAIFRYYEPSIKIRDTSLTLSNFFKLQGWKSFSRDDRVPNLPRQTFSICVFERFPSFNFSLSSPLTGFLQTRITSSFATISHNGINSEQFSFENTTFSR